MKEERMYILKLLSEGKVNAAEAEKLLDALSKKGKRDFWDDGGGETAEEKMKKLAKSAEAFAKDVGSKMESFYTSVEPKVKKTTKVVLEKTASVIDDVSKSLRESVKNFDEKTGADEGGESGAEDSDDAKKD